MKVYKYRSVSMLDRDLASLAGDCFFAPTAAQLNDPTEVMLNDKLVSKLAHGLSANVAEALDRLTTMRHTAGIYSLSKAPTDELMWAHYAESHAGFCIEYDLERLMLEARSQWSRLDVVYAEKPPSLAINDLLDAAALDRLTSKLVGHKSLRWQYEDELRLITARSGSNQYARAALTGIYFGCRCSSATIEKIRGALRDRGHRYFVMKYPAHSYELAAGELPRTDLDGAVPAHEAPIEQGAIATPEDMGDASSRYPLLLKAVEIVRRDPGCERIVGADFSVSPSQRGKIFVQYKTTVKTDLDATVKRYFDDEEL